MMTFCILNVWLEIAEKQNDLNSPFAATGSCPAAPFALEVLRLWAATVIVAAGWSWRALAGAGWALEGRLAEAEIRVRVWGRTAAAGVQEVAGTGAGDGAGDRARNPAVDWAGDWAR